MMTNIYPRELAWPINNERGHTGLFVTFNYIRKRISVYNGVITLALCVLLQHPYSFATRDFYATLSNDREKKYTDDKRRMRGNS